MTRIVISLAFAISLLSCSVTFHDVDPTNEPSEGCIKFDPTDYSPKQTAGGEIPATAPTIVRGTFSRTSGMTVLKVLVAGIAANNDGDDYAAFDATIPLETLQSIAATATGQNVAQLPIDVVTNCGDITNTFMVPIVPRAASALTFATPSPTAIPANGASGVLLVVTGAAADVGISITMTTTLGTLDGAATETVMLAALGSDPPNPQPMYDCGIVSSTAVPVGSAIACVTLLGSGHFGEAVVTARAPNAPPTTQSVTLFGPPLIEPSGISLIDTDSFDITVTDPGATVPFPCVTTQGSGLTIDGSGTSYKVTAVSPTGGAIATLTCADSYGQTTVATYTVPK